MHSERATPEANACRSTRYAVPVMADRISSRRPHFRPRLYSRAVRGLPSEEGEGGRRGSKVEFVWMERVVCCCCCVHVRPNVRLPPTCAEFSCRGSLRHAGPIGRAQSVAVRCRNIPSYLTAVACRVSEFGGGRQSFRPLKESCVAAWLIRNGLFALLCAGPT